MSIVGDRRKRGRRRSDKEREARLQALRECDELTKALLDIGQSLSRLISDLTSKRA